MTERNKEYLRQVDRVLVGGQTNPIDLFSVDLSPVNLLKAVGIHVEKKLNQRQKRHAKVYRNANRKKLLENI